MRQKINWTINRFCLSYEIAYAKGTRHSRHTLFRNEGNNIRGSSGNWTLLRNHKRPKLSLCMESKTEPILILNLADRLYWTESKSEHILSTFFGYKASKVVKSFSLKLYRNRRKKRNGALRCTKIARKSNWQETRKWCSIEPFVIAEIWLRNIVKKYCLEITLTPHPIPLHKFPRALHKKIFLQIRPEPY